MNLMATNLAGEIFKSRSYKKPQFRVQASQPMGFSVSFLTVTQNKPCQILTRAVTYPQSQHKQKLIQHLCTRMLNRVL